MEINSTLETNSVLFHSKTEGNRVHVLAAEFLILKIGKTNSLLIYFAFIGY